MPLKIHKYHWIITNTHSFNWDTLYTVDPRLSEFSIIRIKQNNFTRQNSGLYEIVVKYNQ